MTTTEIWKIIQDNPSIQIITKYNVYMSMTGHHIDEEYDYEKDYCFCRYECTSESYYFKEIVGLSNGCFSHYDRFKRGDEKKVLEFLENVVMLRMPDMKVIYKVNEFHMGSWHYIAVGDLYYTAEQINRLRSVLREVDASNNKC